MLKTLPLNFSFNLTELSFCPRSALKKMKSLILLISALCFVSSFESVSGIYCWQCSGEKEACKGAEDNGVWTLCPYTNTCYAADISKYCHGHTLEYFQGGDWVLKRGEGNPRYSNTKKKCPQNQVVKKTQIFLNTHKDSNRVRGGILHTLQIFFLGYLRFRIILEYLTWLQKNLGFPVFRFWGFFQPR